MKKTATTVKATKRSSSLFTKLTRPLVEQKQQGQATTPRTSSPSLSFSSSILLKGMSERITPPSPNKDKHQSRSNRRRAIDFSRRRTDAPHEPNSDKENQRHSSKPKLTQDIYRFSSTDEPVNMQRSRSKHTVEEKKYYFHSQTNEDLLNNSYGLTLLREQKQKPRQQRHSVASLLSTSQNPTKISSYQSVLNQSASIQTAMAAAEVLPAPGQTLDSMDDLLCDREVESYFYPLPSSLEPDHIYMNLDTPLQHYRPPSSSLSTYIHGTLC